MKKPKIRPCKYAFRCHGDGKSRNGKTVCDMCAQYVKGWNECVYFMISTLNDIHIDMKKLHNWSDEEKE